MKSLQNFILETNYLNGGFRSTGNSELDRSLNRLINDLNADLKKREEDEKNKLFKNLRWNPNNLKNTNSLAYKMVSDNLERILTYYGFLDTGWTNKAFKNITHTYDLFSLIIANMMKHGKNCNLNEIDVTNVEDMSLLFTGLPFNGDISKWDVSGVKKMDFMFNRSDFNGDISNWKVGDVRSMCAMFLGTPFNGDISKWDVRKVTNMEGMFAFSKFNGDISNWKVLSLINGKDMFAYSKFNGDISNWTVNDNIKNEIIQSLNK